MSDLYFNKPNFVIICEGNFSNEISLIKAAGGKIFNQYNHLSSTDQIISELKKFKIKGIIIPYNYIYREDERSKTIIQFCINNDIHIIRAHKHRIPETDWCATVYAYHIMYCMETDWWWVYDEESAYERFHVKYRDSFESKLKSC